jgi:hypothetical protein
VTTVTTGDNSDNLFSGERIQAMTQADYARHRGITRQTVGKLIDAGKIPDSAIVTSNGRRLIDPAAADFALGESVERVTAASIRNDSYRQTNGSAAGRESSGLTKAKTETETYRARLAQIEYEQKVGQLLPVQDVRRAMEKCAGVIVREIDQLPNNAEQIAAAFASDGARGVREVLKKLSRSVRDALSANMELAATDEDVEQEGKPS